MDICMHGCACVTVCVSCEWVGGGGQFTGIEPEEILLFALFMVRTIYVKCVSGVRERMEAVCKSPSSSLHVVDPTSSIYWSPFDLHSYQYLFND